MKYIKLVKITKTTLKDKKKKKKNTTKERREVGIDISGKITTRDG